MNTDQAEASERDQRLDEVIAEYLHDLADGSAPDREVILARHPDLADDLAAFFADGDAIDCWAKPLRLDATADGIWSGSTTPDEPGPRPEPPPAADGTPRIGRFEL